MSDYVPSVTAVLVILIVAFLIGKTFISPIFEARTNEGCNSDSGFAGVMGSAIDNWCENNK